MRSEQAAPNPAEIKRNDRFMGSYVLFVAVRCTFQYVLFPFVLPLIGLNNSLSTGITAAVDVFALGMIGYNIRRLWNTSWRWRYIALSAIMVSILGVFLYKDFLFFFAS
jgi:hypothetical protein